MPIFAALLPLLSTIIGKIFPDQAQADQAKALLFSELAKADIAEWTAKGNVIAAEAGSKSALARSWRPALMYMFMTIIGINYIISPLLASVGVNVVTLQMPPDMWTLLEIGLGGYVVGRSGEKIANTIMKNK